MLNKAFLKSLIAIIGGATFALGSQGLLAQEVEENATEQTGDTTEQDQPLVVEEVVVSGVRRALDNALEVKRDANSVVDNISAEDIDGLPALDLGEALQALPGVQLNRDDGQRNSEISLRGLPGGFTATTAMGQSFATPSRSTGQVGASNPFGSFEASVFDGVTVIKSPTADMQAGGVAGTVDLKMQEALSRPHGVFSVNLGARYEELSDEWDNEFRVAGSWHLIPDKLGIAFKVAGSEQNFRRDTVNFTQYLSMNGATPEEARTQLISQADLDAYRELHGLESNSIIRAIGRAGQVSEVQEGDRVSATFNIEYQVNDDFRLGAHYLRTDRSLDRSNMEDVQYTIRRQRDVAAQKIDLIGAPVQVASNEDGIPTYTVGHVVMHNVDWQPANRVMSYDEEAQGVFLYGDWITDDWEIDGVVTWSESSNQFINEGLDVRHMSRNGTFPNPDGPGRIPWAPTGVDVEVNTGNGNLRQAFVQPLSGINSFVYDGDWAEVTSLSSFSSRLNPLLNGNRRVEFYVNGRVDRPEREINSYEANFQRNLGVGWDAFEIEYVKAGLRYSEETLENHDLRIGAVGINVDALSEATIFRDQLFTEAQNPYFNGDYPGFYGSDAGWLTLDSRNLVRLLQQDMRDVEGAEQAVPSGFNIREAGGRNQFYATNFSVDQAITAGYLMAGFNGLIGSKAYWGNFGVRWVDTDNDILGASLDNGELVSTNTEVDYDHTLPSFNGVLELREDLLLRGAFYRAIVRPNLRALNPSIVLNEGNTSVRVDMPRAEVEPYTADNFDISLEWYNRAGSGISINYFSKKITDLFTRERVCPVGQEDEFGGIFGPLEQIDLPGGSFECQEIEPYVDPETGEVFDNRIVTVNRSYNTNDEIKVNGWELAIQQNLDFLPYPWSGFGGVFNFTKLDTEQANDAALTRVSPESYNLIGYWENEKLSVRLAYNWRAEQLISLPSETGFLGTDAREETERGRLDLSAYYRFNEHFRINVRGYNLTNEQGYEYIGGNDDAVHRITYTGRQYQVSATYVF